MEQKPSGPYTITSNQTFYTNEQGVEIRFETLMQATHDKCPIGNKPEICHYLIALSNVLKIDFTVNVQSSIYCTKPVKRRMNHFLEGVFYPL